MDHYGFYLNPWVVLFWQAFTGLDLACLADLPQDVLEDGKTIAMKLAALEEKKQDESQTPKIAIRRKALLRVFFNL